MPHTSAVSAFHRFNAFDLYRTALLAVLVPLAILTIVVHGLFLRLSFPQLLLPLLPLLLFLLPLIVLDFKEFALDLQVLGLHCRCDLLHLNELLSP